MLLLLAPLKMPMTPGLHAMKRSIHSSVSLFFPDRPLALSFSVTSGGHQLSEMTAKRCQAHFPLCSFSGGSGFGNSSNSGKAVKQSDKINEIFREGSDK